MVELLICENRLELPGWLEVGVTSLVGGEVTDPNPGPDMDEEPMLSPCWREGVRCGYPPSIDGAAEARGSFSLPPLLEDPLSSSISLILASAPAQHEN